MANPTTNFGWQMPTSTDLVTDLPADFEVFGQAVDTDFADLNGGTTGQILSKTSNTDLDFTWVSPNPGDITGVTAGVGISGGGTSGDVTVTNSMATAITTAGDLIKGTGSGTFDRLGIGSSGQVLTVTAGAPAWATATSSRGLNQIIPSSVSVGSGTASVGANGKITLTGVGTNISINGVFSSTYTNYHIVYDLISASSHTALNMRLRVSGTDNTTATSYKVGGLDSSIPFAVSGLTSQTSDSDKFSKLGWVGSVSINGGVFDIFQPFIAAKTTYVGSHFGNAAGDWYYSAGGGSHTEATSYDGFSLLTTQSLTGAIYIYGWQE